MSTVHKPFINSNSDGKLDLMKPVELDLKRAEQGFDHLAKKINVTVCHDMIKEHEETEIIDRNVSRPTTLHSKQFPLSFMHVEPAGYDSHLIMYSKQDGGKHAWATRVLSDEIRKAANDFRHARVTKYKTHENQDGSIAVLVSVKGIKEHDMNYYEELFFTQKLNRDAKETKWIKVYSTRANPYDYKPDRSDFIVAIGLIDVSSDQESESLLVFQERYADTQLKSTVRVAYCDGENQPLWGTVVDDLPRDMTTEMFARYHKGVPVQMVIQKPFPDGGATVIQLKNSKNIANPADRFAVTDCYKEAFSMDDDGKVVKVENRLDVDIVMPESTGRTTISCFIGTLNGKNCFYFDHPKKELFVMSGKTLNSLVFNEHDKTLVLYLIDGVGGLHQFILSEQQDRFFPTEGAPTLLTQHVSDSAPIFDRDLKRHEVFVVKKIKDHFSFNYYFSTGSHWKCEPIKIEDGKDIIKERAIEEVDMLISKISFHGSDSDATKNRSPLHGAVDEKGKYHPLHIKLTASEPVKLKVDDVYYYLEKHAFKTFELSPSGSIKLGIPSNGMHSPLISVEADFMQESFTFNPATDAYERIGRINTPEKYKKPLNRFGETRDSLVQGVDDKTLAVGSKLVNQVHGMVKKSNQQHLELMLNAEGMGTLSDSMIAQLQEAGRQGVFRHGKGEHKQWNQLKVDPGMGRFGFTRNPNGQVDYLDDLACKALFTSPETIDSASLFYSIDNFFSHLYQTIKNGVDAVVNVVFEAEKDVLKVALWIGDKIYKAIIKTVEDVGAALRTVFYTILKIAEDAITSLLSVLLPWDNIQAVYELLNKEINNGLNKATQSFDQLQKQFDHFLSGGETRIKSAIEPFKKAHGKLEITHKEAKKLTDTHRQQMGKMPEQDFMATSLSHNPLFEWVQEKIQQLLTSLPVSLFDINDEKVTTAINELVSGKNGLTDFFTQQKDKMVEIFGDFDVDTLKPPLQVSKIIAMVLSDAGMALMSGSRELAGMFFTFIKKVMAVLMTMWRDKAVNVPFLTTIFHSEKCLNRGAQETCSLMSLVLMLASITVGTLTKLLNINFASPRGQELIASQGPDKGHRIAAYVLHLLGDVIGIIRFALKPIFLVGLQLLEGTGLKVAELIYSGFDTIAVIITSASSIAATSAKDNAYRGFLGDLHLRSIVYDSWTILYSAGNFLLSHLDSAAFGVLRNVTMGILGGFISLPVAGEPASQKSTYNLLPISEVYNFTEQVLVSLLWRIPGLVLTLSLRIYFFKKMTEIKPDSPEMWLYILSLVENIVDLPLSIFRYIGDISGAIFGVSSYLAEKGVLGPGNDFILLASMGLNINFYKESVNLKFIETGCTAVGLCIEAASKEPSENYLVEDTTVV